MVVPFGVSVGDFIAFLGLVRTIVESLREAHGSEARLKDLSARLESLETILKRLEAVEWDDEASSEALEKASIQLRQSVDKFQRKIQKYMPATSDNDAKKWWKDAFRKIKFSLIKDDVAALQDELQAHATGLQIMVNIATGDLMTRMYRNQKDHQRDLADLKRLHYSLVASLSECATELRRLLNALFLLTMATYNIVMVMQSTYFRRIPSRIYFDEPVTIQDACGDYFPIHLKFIPGWNALQTIFEIQFESKPGRQEVKRRNYKMQDASIEGTWSEIDTRRPLDEVLRPGGRVDQLMVFPYIPGTDRCARCKTREQEGSHASKVECQTCNLRYQRASNVSNVVVKLAKGFEMPLNVVTPGDANGSEDDDELEKSVQSCHVDSMDRRGSGGCKSAVDEWDRPLPDDSFRSYRTEEGGSVSIDDFQNVYLSIAPAVYIRDLSGAWYMMPWSVFRSYEGMCFMVEHFCAGGYSSTIELKHWGRNSRLRLSNWHRAYAGMIVEITSAIHPSCVDASGQDPRLEPRTPSATATVAKCHLCLRSFYSRTALGSHAQSHLRDAFAGPEPDPSDTCEITGR